ncbi:hypothetical protein [Arcicella lustrica]|uniref:Uncharacterized protein n=1 Tax=Arcicella lustrica TaxID=2984196 RepID=A0ABU5SHQ9_9BACT|nr:hypothetical protein [Arcicella sp. DC25W]MEA5426814.1 hypothetical protein [Arcicella sp. DC25W]
MMNDKITIKEMFVLKILRIVLPPFHLLKYRWINFWFGKQDGNDLWDKI